MNQQASSPRLSIPLIRCSAVVLTIWAVAGWWLNATPGWLAVVTGCCVGINTWCERSHGNGSRRKLLDIAAIVLFCWALIIAGRFVCTVAAVNHSVAWLAYRATTDEDGIAILAGDISEKRKEEAMPGNVEIHSASAIKSHAEEDRRQARMRWKSLNAEEKTWLLKRWRVTVEGVNQMAWSMIHRNSFTVAYEGTNLLWHLAGIALAAGLSAIPSRRHLDRDMNS